MRRSGAAFSAVLALALAASGAGASQIDRALRPPPSLGRTSTTAAVVKRHLRGGQTLDVQPSQCVRGFKVQGGEIGQLNGVYRRDDAKQVNGRETYWQASGVKFFYFCAKDSTWKVNWGDWYGDESKVGGDNCYYVGYVDSSYPTLPADTHPDWYGWSRATGIVFQRHAHAECVDDCDVIDGTAASSEYPCQCAGATCHASQKCTVSGTTGSCSECPQIQITGVDSAAGWNEGVDGLYSRDDCKVVDGKETYWRTDGSDWYIYYCAEHGSWGISAQHYTSWMVQGGGSCFVKVDGSDDVRSPTEVTQWWGWHEEEWRQLEADWYHALTCPVTDYVPRTCSPTAPPSVSPTAFPTTEDETAEPTTSPTEATHAPTRSGECPKAADLAEVTWTGGTVTTAPITGGTSDWLPSEGVRLLWPEGTWLSCGSMYRLGHNRRVGNGTSIDITCKADVCDVYIFHHNNEYSRRTNGNLPYTLAEWTPSARCATQFSVKTDPPQCRHSMVVRRKQFAEQQSVTVAIDDEIPAMYTVVAVVAGSDCSYNPRRVDRASCESILPGATVSSCIWAEGTCKELWCPSMREAQALAAEEQNGGGAVISGQPGGTPSGGSWGSQEGCPPPDVSNPEAEPQLPETEHTTMQGGFEV